MKRIFILIILLSIFLLWRVYASNSILINKVIYIDPGHGGYDPGAIYKELKESEINLEYAYMLKEKLEQEGAVVYLTRYDDYDLSSSTSNHKRSDMLNRVKIIKETSPDIFISLHLNAESSSLWYGAQTFYNSINSKNVDLAASIQEKLQEKTNTKRKIKKDKDIFLLRNLKIPGVLVELGFITNASDRVNLTSETYKEKLVQTLVEGIKDYFSKQ